MESVLLAFFIGKKPEKSAPTAGIRSKTKAHLLIGVSCIANGFCLIPYCDHNIRCVQLYRETSQEKYRENKEDLENLKRLGVTVYRDTCDGHRVILKAIRKVFSGGNRAVLPGACQTSGGNYLSGFPKTQAGQ